MSLLVEKLRIRKIYDKVEKLKASSFPAEEEKHGTDVNFCKQNHWGSYDCLLCKNLMRSLA